jgi:homocysteine S-methyltransferase
VTASTGNPILPFLEQQGVVILDGGLATELEARGHDLRDDLWSARILMDAPEVIRQVHLDYLSAGADCIVTASYQASLSRFEQRGLSEDDAAALIRLSVRLAVEARDDFWSDPESRLGRLRPIVAASVGPYGAFLADGSEYTGRYDLVEESLVHFHRPRWQILSASDADLLACETIPSRGEARALRSLLREAPKAHAWFSFSCRDGQHLSDGSRLADTVRDIGEVEQVVAVGVNCTAPKFISNLIAEASAGCDKPIVVYPNSGEKYDAQRKQWLGTGTAVDFADASSEWVHLGADLIGGCCRTGPEHIRRMRKRLLGAGNERQLQR